MGELLFMQPWSPAVFTREAEAFRAECRLRYLTELDYSIASLAVVDGILGEAWHTAQLLPQAQAKRVRTSLTLGAGCYVGELVRRFLDARWVREGAGVDFADWVLMDAGGKPDRYPVFTLVANILETGPKDTLLRVLATADAWKPALERSAVISRPRRTS